MVDHRTGHDRPANDAPLADYAREQALRLRLEAIVKAETRGASPLWIEQAFSPLGPRKHIKAVRERIAQAEARGIPATELGAARDKRRYLLTPESVAEELGRQSVRKARPVANDTDAEESAYAELMARASSRAR